MKINNSYKNISYDSNVTTIIEKDNHIYDSTLQVERAPQI